MKKELLEFLEQVKESNRIIEMEEERLEGLYKRIDEILEAENIDILSLNDK
jgi:hypothetical protein